MSFVYVRVRFLHECRIDQSKCVYRQALEGANIMPPKSTKSPLLPVILTHELAHTEWIKVCV